MDNEIMAISKDLEMNYGKNEIKVGRGGKYVYVYVYRSTLFAEDLYYTIGVFVEYRYRLVDIIRYDNCFVFTFEKVGTNASNN